MHVVFVVAALGAGGAERVIAQLATIWSAGGRTVTVISFDREDAPVYHDFGARVRLLRLAVPPGVAVMVWPRRIVALRTALRSLQPDAVISFLTKINAVTLLATVGLRTPVIVSERNNPRRQAASRWWTLLLDRLYPRADGIVIQTTASRECLPPAVAERAVVIANPVSRPAGRPTGGQAPGPAGKSLVAVGRLEPQKGFDRLLTAFATVATRHPDWQLTIWGEGPCRAALAQQSAALGMEGQVLFAGLSAAPLGWIDGADAFVLSSRHEGFPNALAEAMAAGLAVAAFDCPYGPGEMIAGDGSNGLLVPDGDVTALAGALSLLMGNAALRARLGNAARASMAGCEPARIAEKWDRLLTSVTAGAATA